SRRRRAVGGQPADPVAQRMGPRQADRRDDEPGEEHLALELIRDVESEARQQEQADHRAPLQQHTRVALAEVPLHEGRLFGRADAPEELAGDDEHEERQRPERGRQRIAIGDLAAEKREDDDDGVELLQQRDQRRLHIPEPYPSVCERFRNRRHDVLHLAAAPRPSQPFVLSLLHPGRSSPRPEVAALRRGHTGNVPSPDDNAWAYRYVYADALTCNSRAFSPPPGQLPLARVRRDAVTALRRLPGALRRRGCSFYATMPRASLHRCASYRKAN